MPYLKILQKFPKILLKSKFSNKKKNMRKIYWRKGYLWKFAKEKDMLEKFTKQKGFFKKCIKEKKIFEKFKEKKNL